MGWLNMKIPFAFMNKGGVVPTWPYGLQGDLVVNNGQTYTLYANTVYDFNSVTVNAGGTIYISTSGTNGNTVTIGCKNDFILNGNITKQGLTTGVGGTYSRPVTEIGETLSHSIAQKLGGGGGRGGYYAPTALIRYGGAQSQGRGGGGGGTSSNLTDAFAYGGTGGAGGSNGGNSYNTVPLALGGIGGGTGNGSAGANFSLFVGNNTGTTTRTGGNGSGGGGAGATFFFKDTYRYAGGGGGGYRGTHGTGIAIVTHKSISGSGTIFNNGQNGFAGGKGGNDTAQAASSGGGGGGGGGAGGSGGTVWLYHRTGASVGVNISGGSGGLRGLQGSANAMEANRVTGTNGVSGQSGNSGAVIYSTTWQGI